jgi:hypothetical protein
MAHIRKATKGDIDIGNTQPFCHKKLRFMHNGTVEGFDKYGHSDSRVMFSQLLEATEGASCIYKVHWYLRKAIISKIKTGTLNFVLQGDSYTMIGRIARNKNPIPLYYKLDLEGFRASSKNIEAESMSLLPKNHIGIFSRNHINFSVLKVS